MEHALSAAELLKLWERARTLPPMECALTFAAANGAGGAPEQLAHLSIGQRDAELLKLREKLFGSRMSARTNCPACGDAMELNFSVGEIQAQLPPAPAQKFSAKFGEYEIAFRLPNSSDLALIVPGEEIAIQKRRLAQRCLLSASRGDLSVAAEQLPAEAVNALSEHMSELDPQGDVQLALSCPRCAHHWDAPFDIVSFIWSEVQAWAARLLREIHLLASTYGWAEADILALTPTRRQAYLELIEQ